MKIDKQTLLALVPEEDCEFEWYHTDSYKVIFRIAWRNCRNEMLKNIEKFLEGQDGEKVQG